MSETRIRASAAAKLFDCAHKFEWENMMGHSNPAGIRALLGTSIHKGTAVFDQGRIDNSGITPDDAAGAFIDTLHHPEFEVNMNQDDLTIKQAEAIGLNLHTKYCLDVSPRYKFLSVELEVKPLKIDCGGGITIVLTGTMDRSRVSADAQSHRPRVVDMKSGAVAVQKGRAKTKGHGPQVGEYQLLLEHTIDKPVDDVAEIIGLKTKGKQEIATGEIIGAKQAMVGDCNHPGFLDYAAQMFRTGMFPPNPSSMLCGEKYCARWESCIYRDR